MVKIVYACNDGYMDGLYLSILSILRRSKETFEFYILTADYTSNNPKYKCFSKENTKVLDKLAKSYNPTNFVKTIDCTILAKSLLTFSRNINRKKFSPYTNLRLLIDHYPEFGDKIIYLDSDIMANGDIKELNDIDIGDNEMGVCHNWWLRRTLKKDSFNAGVIVFNLKKTKETKLFKKAIEWFNKKHFVWADQTVLYLAATKYMFFPGNEYKYNYQKNRLGEGTILKHFCACPYHWPKHNNIKQHRVEEVHKYLKIYAFDEDYEIWKKAREEWKNRI